MALNVDGNNYFEVCLAETGACNVGVITKYGDFVTLINPANPLPGYNLGDLIQIGPNGEKIARLQPAFYQKLLAGGLEKTLISAAAKQDEIDKVQRDLNDSLQDCLVGVGACVGTAMATVGAGPFGWSVAAIACYQSYRACVALDKANKALFEQRKALESKLKEEGEKAAADARAAAGGGAGSVASTGSRVEEISREIWIDWGFPARKGIVTVTDVSRGGGGGTGSPIRHN